jgi:UDP-N-acetylglucosamine 2-epimerase (non-hydrolysing)
MDADFELYPERLLAQCEGEQFAIAVVTATKPDFYKQAPIVAAAEEQNLPCFVIHTGQHYDDVLGHGLEEYGLEEQVAVDLGVRGDLTQKTAQMHRSVARLVDELDAYDTTILPIVHGDTHAAGIFPQAWLFATNQRVAHNEAGLRGMAPTYESLDSPESLVTAQWEGEWTIERSEPFPEQYDTFVGSAASLYQFAPVALNREHLVSEGYPETVNGEKRIPVVGNSVVDAIEMKADADLEESIFDRYPVLERRDDWLRVDIHRRANLLRERFTAIIDGVVALVEAGYNVVFIEMTATRRALERYGYRERLERLAADNENFLFTGLWRKHAHVYEFLTSGQCFAELTDSGSMQEELNQIDEAICLTARFNTDRPETVFDAETNLLVPPVSGQFVREMVEHVAETDAVRNRIQTGEKLYGRNVGDRIVEFLRDVQDDGVFQWTHERLGFDRGSDEAFEYL